MLGYIEDFDGTLFICTESEIESIEKLGIDLKLHETNNYDEKMHWMHEPAYFFRLQDEDDRHFLKITHKCRNIRLGDLYGNGPILRVPKKA